RGLGEDPAHQQDAGQGDERQHEDAGQLDENRPVQDSQKHDHLPVAVNVEPTNIGDTAVPTLAKVKLPLRRRPFRHLRRLFHLVAKLQQRVRHRRHEFFGELEMARVRVDLAADLDHQHVLAYGLKQQFERVGGKVLEPAQHGKEIQVDVAAVQIEVA